MDVFENELENLMSKYSILKNDEIKESIIKTLSKYTDYDNDFVILDVENKKIDTTTQYELTPEMEKILDDSLDEIELEDASTQTCFIEKNNNNIKDTCNCKKCTRHGIDDMLDDIDRTFNNISYGIDEIGSYIGQWFDNIIDDKSV